MPVYFQKLWHDGTDRDNNPGEVMDIQWAKPKYRPGQVVRYKTATGEVRVGTVRYALREGEDRIDYYRVLVDDTPDITFDCQIVERVEDQ